MDAETCQAHQAVNLVPPPMESTIQRLQLVARAAGNACVTRNVQIQHGALYGSLSNHPRFPQSPLVIGQVDRKLLAPLHRTLDPRLDLELHLPARSRSICLPGGLAAFQTIVTVPMQLSRDPLVAVTCTHPKTLRLQRHTRTRTRFPSPPRSIESHPSLPLPEQYIVLVCRR
jgi:hypothetical protein